MEGASQGIWPASWGCLACHLVRQYGVIYATCNLLKCNHHLKDHTDYPSPPSHTHTLFSTSLHPHSGFGGEDDAELEAELMALEGKSSGKQAKKKGGKMDLDSLIAGANKIGEDVEDDDEEDLSDIDDEELLGELQVCSQGGT